MISSRPARVPQICRAPRRACCTGHKVDKHLRTVALRIEKTQSARSTPACGALYLWSSATRLTPRRWPRANIFSRRGAWMQYTRSVRCAGSSVDSSAAPWRASRDRTSGRWWWNQRSSVSRVWRCFPAAHCSWSVSRREQTEENGRAMLYKCATETRALSARGNARRALC